MIQKLTLLHVQTGTPSSEIHRIPDMKPPSNRGVPDHRSPAVFPVGLTTVTMTAGDIRSNILTGAFTVTVTHPTPSTLAALIEQGVSTGDVDPVIATSLRAKLDAALSTIDSGGKNAKLAAINKLEALINEVEAQTGKKISKAAAEAIIAMAKAVILGLSAP